MSEPVIIVEDLSKSYTLRHKQAERYSTLRDVIAGRARNAFKRQDNETKGNAKEEFLALRDVSFEINKGDRVGIIGRNGAGKSTLLKILSRITEPSKGRITIDGRVSSLLEVGTGFHAELTGRENIFLNGAILGMGKREIESKFDEIVAFAEIDKFLDTPVKRYSSGMYVRLAFSVAAHLEPDILIVDEVLAVGDSVFQKKCIDRMTAIGKEGRTILFVSHNISAVEALCTKAILIDKGTLVAKGDVKQVTEMYNDYNTLSGNDINLAAIERDNNYKKEIIFEKIHFEESPVKYGKNIVFDITLRSNVKRRFADVDFGVNVMDKRHNCVVHCSNRFIAENIEHTDDRDTYRFEIENNIKPGNYQLVLFLRTEDTIQDLLEFQVGFEISDGNPYGFNDTSQIQGATLPKFSIKKII
ncbi:MAG TPA: polysaccharide ABC transporter ATP-binding protein [Bacteroidia bacterium]|jgi:lipopolysaccharide transport system ATP-binding protein|nr:polysaccharide ABC transporter ATP-binding protein [Bacteroidia bacterium]